MGGWYCGVEEAEEGEDCACCSARCSSAIVCSCVSARCFSASNNAACFALSFFTAAISLLSFASYCVAISSAVVILVH